MILLKMSQQEPKSDANFRFTKLYLDFYKYKKTVHAFTKTGPCKKLLQKFKKWSKKKKMQLDQVMIKKLK